MERVSETPVKRQNGTGSRASPQRIYNSEDDSGDDLFDQYETIETLPVTKASASLQANSKLEPYPMTYETQPTQLVEIKSTQADQASKVQVAASSPAPSPPPPLRGGKLAVSMAPPGTLFKLPHGVVRPETQPRSQPRAQNPPSDVDVIEISDDEMPYVGGSSDEEHGQQNGIKPAVIKEKKAAPPSSTTASQGSGQLLFNEIISKAAYKPGTAYQGSVYDSRNRDESTVSSRITGIKRGPDVTTTSGGLARDNKKSRVQNGPSRAMPVQSGPSRANPVQPDLDLDDVPDYQLRQKIGTMKIILPDYSNQQMYEALIQARGNMEDALTLLTDQDQSVEEAEDMPVRVAAKQQLKNPVKSILEKYSASQAPKLPPTFSPPKPQEKPKRRLVKGRKHPSSPAREPSPREETPETTDSEAAVSEEVDNEFDVGLLKFFNTCSAVDLIDLASASNEAAELIISRRPFKNLEQIQEVSDEKETKNGKRSKKIPVGERILTACEGMWRGYNAVDVLVKKCEDLSKPVAEEMKTWGVDVFGSSKDGELELVEVQPKTNGLQDSGIGTPKSAATSLDEDQDVRPRGKGSRLFPQPAIMDEDVVLKDYQVIGINWLSLLFRNGLSCILADDMGLGKTCQVVAFFAHLLETGERGPHMVVVPTSTLENWLREFQKFCSNLTVQPYHGSQAERREIQETIRYAIEQDEQEDIPHVIVTTYTIAKNPEDRKFLRHLKPKVCVYDEGHALKSRTSKVYDQLMKIGGHFRLLLTGTPLQNNLNELASLLGFMLPEVFREHDEDLQSIFKHRATTTDTGHQALLSEQRIARARSMMTPFILRRKKHQVLDLPTKTTRVEYCDMTKAQKELYQAEWERNEKLITERASGAGVRKQENAMMTLRKAALHPLLFRRYFDDARLTDMAKLLLREPEYAGADVEQVVKELSQPYYFDYNLHKMCVEYGNAVGKHKMPGEPWMNSGKVEKLVEMLREFKSNGDRVLVFSQFKMALDILEEVFNTISMKFCRLDGDTPVAQRQELIDLFRDDDEITVFMLSTKAGGAGINLPAANKVVIFDCSFNPQDDIQAENRAHRVGQTRPVEVVRLVTRGTIEEQILKLGETKLALDSRVAGEGGGGGENDDAADKEGQRRVREMLLGGGRGKASDVDMSEKDS